MDENSYTLSVLHSDRRMDSEGRRYTGPGAQTRAENRRSRSGRPLLVPRAARSSLLTRSRGKDATFALGGLCSKAHRACGASVLHACMCGSGFALGAWIGASICFLRRWFRSLGRCFDPACTEMHAGFARARGEGGFCACHAFSHVFRSFRHACHAKRARVAWLVHAPQKSGFTAAIGEADQGHGVGLWATGTPQDTHGDA